MTFSEKVKQELVSVSHTAECCRHAMCYGMLLFGKSFTRSSISVLSENEIVAKRYVELLKEETGIEAQIIVTDANNYKINITDKEEIKKIYDCFSVSDKELKKRINRGNLQNLCQSEEIDNCCDRAFIAGVFLVCGNVSDPKRGYHVEFVVPYKQLSLDLLKVLKDNRISANVIDRRGVNVVYIKDSTAIENLLNLMGAPIAELELIQVKVEKSVINRINRANNFEFANIARTANAAAEQMSAIETIYEKGTFEYLPEDLKQVAELRNEYPDSSLSALGEMFDPPLSRSSVNYKLKRLIAFSKKSREELEKSAVISEDEN